MTRKSYSKSYTKIYSIVILSFFGLLVLACNNQASNKLVPLVEAEVAVEETTTKSFADTVFINGKILTVDNFFSIVESLAVDEERIVAIGSNADVNGLIGDTTQVIDLDGKTVIPGLVDNHIHFIRMPQRWNLQARIDGINTRQAALDVIAEKAASMEPGEWIMVQGGWSEGQFADEAGGFTLQELDAAAPNNPVFLQIL
jgi:predicted amidohydrolase YtcJ